MKNLTGPLCCAFLILCNSCNTEQAEWIRINQPGYRPGDVKVAVFVSSKPVDITSFSLIDAGSDKIIKTFRVTEKSPPLSDFVSCYLLNFSELQSTGSYRIKAGKAVSPELRIADDVYVDFGRREIITPWIGSDTARHYQWYPFMNMGHALLAGAENIPYSTEFAGYSTNECTMDGTACLVYYLSSIQSR